MTAYELSVIDAINLDAISNLDWGVCHRVWDTRRQFGTLSSRALKGTFITVCLAEGVHYTHLDRIVSTFTFRVEGGDELRMYQIEITK